jgi:epoxyqueuosine reductase
VLDSRSCISYLTIEHRGGIAPARAATLGDWIFGCDICQEVCPWNLKFARAANDPALEYDGTLARLDLAYVSSIPDDEFEARFGATALARAGASGMRRNAKVALKTTRESEGGRGPYAHSAIVAAVSEHRRSSDS